MNNITVEWDSTILSSGHFNYSDGNIDQLLTASLLFQLHTVVVITSFLTFLKLLVQTCVVRSWISLKFRFFLCVVMLFMLYSPC